MIGRLAMFVANRATGGAVEGFTRRATWSAAGLAFCVCASIFALFALYWTLEQEFGSIASAGMIAGGALVIGLICLAAPSVLEWSEKQTKARARAEVRPLTTTVEAAKQETAAAVDYFGPLQVVASAFLVGMRTGQQLRRPRA